MGIEYIVDSHGRHISTRIHQQAIEQSVWRSYAELTGPHGPKRVGAFLEGFDLPSSKLQGLFDAWQGSSTRGRNVSYVRCGRYTQSSMRSALARLLEDVNVFGEIESARTIFIKVGLIESVEWSRHVTPTPSFLEALVGVLQERSPNAQIMIGDGSGHERDTDLLLRWTGLHPLLRKHPEVSFIDLNTDDLAPVNVENPYTFRQLLLPKTLLESDVTISLAKLKTHKWTGVSLGMKNLFGAMPGSVYGFPKNRLHWASYPRAICDIWSAVRPTLTIIDGIVGVEGDGPLNGNPISTGIIVGGKDPVAADGLATTLMGMSPHLIPTFWFACLRGLGHLGPTGVTQEIAEIVKAFTPPTTYMWLHESAFMSHDEQLALAKSHLVGDQGEVTVS